jgi:hypothetical protein
VKSLQVRIGLVLRVAVAVPDERVRLALGVAAHTAFAPRAFVDVVTQEEHEVGVLLQQVTMCSEVPDLEVLTRRESKLEWPRARARVGRGAGAADRADRVAGPEAVEVRARRLQPSHVDVHAVAERRHGVHAAPARDLPEALVVSDLPLDRVGKRPETAPLQGFRRQPCPQHDSGR